MLENFGTLLEVSAGWREVQLTLRKLRPCKTTVIRSPFGQDCGPRIQESVFSGLLTLNLGLIQAPP